jgi:hypothetical protein
LRLRLRGQSRDDLGVTGCEKIVLYLTEIAGIAVALGQGIPHAVVKTTLVDDVRRLTAAKIGYAYKHFLALP